ncbi:hypothetical protein COLO4_03773 [Corchorus olitorius]|uniref:Uncharacterized protein n=1 Tax=Corchorus olitorius TaxID=93759 RepID=A0A1R3KWS2_9ROSI|nr:hypothetical protein COLO4_03773 [Corchorus olitorius]
MKYFQFGNASKFPNPIPGGSWWVPGSLRVKSGRRRSSNNGLNNMIMEKEGDEKKLLLGPIIFPKVHRRALSWDPPESLHKDGVGQECTTLHVVRRDNTHYGLDESSSTDEGEKACLPSCKFGMNLVQDEEVILFPHSIVVYGEAEFLFLLAHHLTQHVTKVIKYCLNGSNRLLIRPSKEDDVVGEENMRDFWTRFRRGNGEPVFLANRLGDMERSKSMHQDFSDQLIGRVAKTNGEKMGDGGWGLALQNQSDEGRVKLKRHGTRLENGVNSGLGFKVRGEARNGVGKRGGRKSPITTNNKGEIWMVKPHVLEVERLVIKLWTSILKGNENRAVIRARTS